MTPSWIPVHDIFTGGILNYNLAQDGVGLAPFHETDVAVSASVKSWLEVVRQKLINDEITPDGACLTPHTINLPIVKK